MLLSTPEYQQVFMVMWTGMLLVGVVVNAVRGFRIAGHVAEELGVEELEAGR
ncbi:MAG TPA: hypothetical protein P5571_11690 [Candidatus Krumholzibacteria bacterium]|nr:hypothetical protein [Candidatus Krumholzibacteria bacterium]HRX52021.1 hypothetical protein [Candidatus Krumholzibacteria bacterium]